MESQNFKTEKMVSVNPMLQRCHAFMGPHKDDDDVFNDGLDIIIVPLRLTWERPNIVLISYACSMGKSCHSLCTYAHGDTRR